MAEYVEEYLVALGYDLKSEDGQKYLQMCEDMEKRHEELVKSGKNLTDSFGEQSKAQQVSITGDKEEAEQLAKLDDMYRQLYKTQSETTQVKPVAPEQNAPAGTTAAPRQPPGPEAPQVPKQSPPAPPAAPGEAPKAPPQKAPAPAAPGKTSGDQEKRIEGDRQEINLLGEMEKTVRQIGAAWAQLERGNIFGAFTQGIKGIKQFAEMLDKAGSSAQAAEKKAGNLKKTLSEVLKGKSGSAVGEAAEDTSAAGLAATAAMVAAGAAIGVVAKEIYNLADGLAEASINVEIMSRKLWITDSAAWQLGNTLSAMGKTTADLNDIALSPTLREQFQTLQDYQKTTLQLPEDFKEVSDKWNEGVTKNNAELRLSLTYLKEMAQYRTEKIFEPVFEGLIWSAKKAVVGLTDLLNGKVDLALPWTSSNSAQGTAANYAPQTSSYTQYEGAKVTYAPHIEITASSDKGSEIAAAVSDATQQGFNESALLKSVQGLNR